MKLKERTEVVPDTQVDSVSRPLDALLSVPVRVSGSVAARASMDGARVGTIVGFTDNGATALVTYSGQVLTGARAARATLDLHAAHIGRSVVLVFENGDETRPIVVGCLHEHNAKALPAIPERVEIDANGNRLVVTAKDSIVLRCGKASLTLTKEGRVIIEGAYVSAQSSGVLRVKGGSVQIN
jgi:hypothetical protein